MNVCMGTLIRLVLVWMSVIDFITVEQPTGSPRFSKNSEFRLKDLEQWWLHGGYENSEKSGNSRTKANKMVQI